MPKLQQIYHHYEKWEEYHCGMWRIVTGEERIKMLKKAIEFIGNTQLYGKYMMKVLDQWPASCEQNMTCSSLNRQAWIGQAACCLSTGSPESVTRAAWRFLTKQQQDEANHKADLAITEWERRFFKQQNKTHFVQLEFFNYA